jgi:hypothetical protein
LIHVLGEDGYAELQSFHRRQDRSHASFVHEKAMR